MLIDIATVKKCLEEASLKVRGILHVGSHICEERSKYNKDLGIPDSKIVWVDANEDVVKQNVAQGIPNCYTAAIDATERDATFHIVSNIQSSSLLELGTHAQSYPSIKVTQTRQVRTKTLPQFLQETGLDITKYNMWNFDIQGNELNAYRGAGDLFKHCDVLYTGADTDDVYKGCGKLHDLDVLLEQFGLYRVHTNITPQRWGDVLYVRKASPYTSQEPIDMNYVLYEKICDRYGDAHDYLMTLSKYARDSESVLEFGGKSVSPTWAFMNGLKKNKKQQKRLVTYFLQECHEFEKVKTAAQQNGIDFTLAVRENVGFLQNTHDMVYIDTWHVYGQLKRELARFHGLANKYIVIHGTEMDKETGESIRVGHDLEFQSKQTGLPVEEITQGTQRAIDEFLASHPEWKLKEHLTTSYGLTVLKKE